MKETEKNGNSVGNSSNKGRWQRVMDGFTMR